MLSYRLKGPKDGPLLSFIKLAIEIVLTIVLAGVFQMTIKQFINVEPDEHIFKFLQAKFGISLTDDFDAKIRVATLISPFGSHVASTDPTGLPE